MVIEQEATRATALGEAPLTPALTAAGIALRVECEAGAAEYRTRAGDTPQSAVEELNRRLRARRIPVALQIALEGRLLAQHQHHGSGHSFGLSSSAPGVLSQGDGGPRRVENGRDVQGTIHGEAAYGKGHVLTGCPGNRRTDGLSIHFSGLSGEGGARPAIDAAALIAGSVFLAQHGLSLQLGADKPHLTTVRLASMRPTELARGVENASGFQSLAEIGLLSPGAPEDAGRLIAQAHREVQEMRKRLVRLTGPGLAQHLAGLRIRAANLAAAEPRAWQPEMARAIAQTLRERLQTEQGMALTAQGGTPPGPMIRLLSGEPERTIGGA